MFKRVDPSQLITFGTDENFFLFVADNSADPSDPLVFTVDHAETDQEPFDCYGMTLSTFLPVLQKDG
jgi:hypothetical protein